MLSFRRLNEDSLVHFLEQANALQNEFPGGDAVVAADYFEKNGVYAKAYEIAAAGGSVN